MRKGQKNLRLKKDTKAKTKDKSEEQKIKKDIWDAIYPGNDDDADFE
jgi:hypothetical protein